MTNNLSETLVRIPEVEIRVSKDWKNCLDVIIMTKEGRIEYNLEKARDLFIVLKSYSSNIKYVPKNFYVRINKSTLNGMDLVMKNERARFIEKMNFEEFLDWWKNRIIRDNNYLNEESLYSYTFSYNLKILNLEENILYPKYPWNQHVYGELRIIEEKDEFTKILISNLREENTTLRREVEELRREVEKNKVRGLVNRIRGFWKK